MLLPWYYKAYATILLSHVSCHIAISSIDEKRVNEYKSDHAFNVLARHIERFIYHIIAFYQCLLDV